MKSQASTKVRLKNISRNEQVPFQQVIYRYLHERFFYRLSKSNYVNTFILKGGNLMFVNYGLLSRPTKDIDYLAINISNNKEKIKEVFSEIIQISYPPDNVHFYAESIKIETITENDKYSGLRVYIEAGIDSIKQKLQIDIGYGDIITPNARTLNYPVLLNDNDSPIIKAYNNETVIAEKFQAMIELSEFNSRMKDFYDIYSLLKLEQIDKAILAQAIKNTFSNRKTHYTSQHALFSKHFAEDENRTKMWKAFLRKINSNENIEFNEVMGLIKSELLPVLI